MKREKYWCYKAQIPFPKWLWLILRKYPIFKIPFSVQIFILFFVFFLNRETGFSPASRCNSLQQLVFFKLYFFVLFGAKLHLFELIMMKVQFFFSHKCNRPIPACHSIFIINCQGFHDTHLFYQSSVSKYVHNSFSASSFVVYFTDKLFESFDCF